MVTLSHTGVGLAPLQNSIVHLLPSSGQVMVGVGTQNPDWQLNVKQGVEVPHNVPSATGVGKQNGAAGGKLTQTPVEHSLPVLQLPVRGVCTQPVGTTHESSVHGLPSSQLRGVFSQAPVCGLHELFVQASGFVQVTIGVPEHAPF
ncbi:MAG TPA: hypothetical protein VMW56_00905 [Candidatus Margulisiibacteriota bacterium]|nr:hypothetical protein [Candidatus Margulisiibacteriota bacterium]